MIEKQPLPDVEFRGMRLQFTRVEYNDIPAEREILKETEDYAAEEVILRYPSGDTLSLYIAMPKPLPKNLQSVIFMPSGGAFLIGPTPNRTALDHFENKLKFVIRSGRACIVPIWDLSRNDPSIR